MRLLSLFIILGGCTTVALEAQQVPRTNPDIGKQQQNFTSKQINPYGLTPSEMQELAAARQEALKANPDLAGDLAALRQKMHDFQHKLDLAIVQADPNVAPVVANIERGPGAPLPMQPNGAVTIPANAPTASQSR